MANSTTLERAIRVLVAEAESDSDGYFEAVRAIASIFPPRLKAQLQQLVRGPVWDGDVINKGQRAELFEMGIAIRVCHKGEQGYTGSKYIGYSILKAMEGA